MNNLVEARQRREYEFFASYGQLWYTFFMKRVFLLILFFSAVSSVFLAGAKWAEPANWSKLGIRMTAGQVTQVLGNPIHRDSGSAGAIWYYQDAPRVDGAKIIRPDYGIVRLRTMNRVLVVVDWAEPDWEKVPKEESPVESEEPPEQEAAVEDATEPAEQPKTTTRTLSRRPARDLSPEAIEKQREETKALAEKLAAERKARREKLAAEYAERELEPVKKPKSIAHPLFFVGGLMFLAAAVTFIVYGKFFRPE